MSLNFEVLNQQLEKATPQEIIAWAVDNFWPDIAMSSSFQSQSLPLLHMVAQTAPQLPVIFLDTRYHFPETLAFRDDLIQKWELTVRNVQSAISQERFISEHGEQLYRRDPDLCCHINKVEPMRLATKDLRAWISGIRRDQSSTRVGIQIVEKTPHGLIRVHPMATWTSQDVWRYINHHQLPDHPLLSQGYMSIGCQPCTKPIHFDENERSGRWEGNSKTECGLHTVLRTETVQLTYAQENHL